MSGGVFGRWQLVAGFLALVVAVFAVPLTAVDARDRSAADRLERTGRWYDVDTLRVHVQQHVSKGVSSYAVDREEATYTSGGASHRVALRGFDESQVPREQPGWYATYRAAPDVLPLRVRTDGHDAFLEADYDAERGSRLGLAHVVLAVWVGFWSLLWYAGSLRRRQRQRAQGVATGTVRRLAVQLAVVWAGLLTGLYLLSFAL